jgi:hypothetical protein
MLWKLAGLAVIAVAIVVLFFAPIASVDVNVDLPSGVSPPTTNQLGAIFDIVKWATWLIGVGCLGLVAWLARRTIRYHRGIKDAGANARRAE